LIDGLLADTRAQLERLVALYQAGSFPKEMLVDHKERLEAIIGSLGKERGGQVARIEAHTLTNGLIQWLQDLVE